MNNVFPSNLHKLLVLTRYQVSFVGKLHGGPFLAKFWVRVCRPQFQKGTVGLTNFCENDTLG